MLKTQDMWSNTEKAAAPTLGVISTQRVESVFSTLATNKHDDIKDVISAVHEVVTSQFVSMEKANVASAHLPTFAAGTKREGEPELLRYLNGVLTAVCVKELMVYIDIASRAHRCEQVQNADYVAAFRPRAQHRAQAAPAVASGEAGATVSRQVAYVTQRLERDVELTDKRVMRNVAGAPSDAKTVGDYEDSSGSSSSDSSSDDEDSFRFAADTRERFSDEQLLAQKQAVQGLLQLHAEIVCEENDNAGASVKWSSK